MERISEVEEDKYNTIIDKHNDANYREEFRIDDKNFDEFMNKNINSSNLKEYFDPNMNFNPNFNNTDSSNRYKEHSQNQKFNQIEIQHGKSTNQAKRVEEDLYKDAENRVMKKKMIEENVKIRFIF